ncbi:type I secretion system permease/ATPase [bacterium]|nr:type I secretion system permease/ATPase [bacterium]
MTANHPPAGHKPTPLNPLLKRMKDAFWYPIRHMMTFSLVTNMLMLVVPLFSLQVMDRVLGSYSIDTLILLTIIAVTMLIFMGVFYAVRMVIASRMAEWVDQKLTPEILSYSISQTAQKLSPQGSQNLRDLTSIKQFLLNPGLQTMLDAPWTPIYFIVIFMISITLGCVTLIGGICLLVLAWLTNHATEHLVKESTRHSHNLLRLSDSAHRNAEMVEAMGMAPAIIHRWQQANRELATPQMLASQRQAIIQSSSKSFRMMIQIAITGLGAFLVLHNQLSPGAMIAASILSGRALGPFEAAISLWKTTIQVKDAWERLNTELSHGITPRGSMAMPAPRGELVVDRLVYRVAGNEVPILKGVSFVLKPGESLGIIGPAAAGKSTLTKLIAGVWQPHGGHVRLDGVDMYQWNREDAGRYIGYVPQDVEMFEGTIRDNIARMKPDATDADVVRAAQLAGVHELILTFPQGYDTYVHAGLSSLSPGQKQRVALARAFYGMPKFIVMDEPNSNLDGDGELALIRAIQYAKEQGATLVVVAHKPSIIARLDKIMMLRQGMVEAFGSRDEVLPRYLGPTPAKPQPEAVQEEVSARPKLKRQEPKSPEGPDADQDGESA